jgi:hypothetical protein
VPVVADASDNQTVGSVQFFVDGASIGTDPDGSNGWSVNWNTVLAGNGDHDLTATAADQSGNLGTSTVVSVAVDNPTTQTLDIAVAASSDDAEEKTSNNSTRINSSDLEFVTDKSFIQVVGMRFTGITVPQGATITNAYVQFQAGAANAEATNLVVRGQAADNPPTFTTKSSNISNRPVTAASVAWVPPAWIGGARGVDQRTSNLSVVLQEIVNRAGWSPGNAVVLVVTGSGLRKAEAFDSDGGPALAPVLHIEFSLS